MTENDWLGPLGLDLGAAALCLAIVLVYELTMRLKARRDPAYTVQSVNAIARTAWVEGIMTGTGKDILAVQTLRNSIMGPTFLASTAVLLMMGTLTLTAQGDKLSSTWHALNVGGATTEALFTTKVLLLLLVFFVAFFAFSLAIRLFIHVGFMINVPRDLAHGAITPASVAHHLNRAGRYHTIGLRAYYYSVPLVFWLFGPQLMVAATLALIAALFRIDRAPSGESEG
jgi:uncharacterized membrane protein